MSEMRNNNIRKLQEEVRQLQEEDANYENDIDQEFNKKSNQNSLESDMNYDYSSDDDQKDGDKVETIIEKQDFGFENYDNDRVKEDKKKSVKVKNGTKVKSSTCKSKDAKRLSSKKKSKSDRKSKTLSMGPNTMDSALHAERTERLAERARSRRAEESDKAEEYERRRREKALQEEEERYRKIEEKKQRQAARMKEIRDARLKELEAEHYEIWKAQLKTMDRVPVRAREIPDVTVPTASTTAPALTSVPIADDALLELAIIDVMFIEQASHVDRIKLIVLPSGESKTFMVSSMSAFSSIRFAFEGGRIDRNAALRFELMTGHDLIGAGDYFLWENTRNIESIRQGQTFEFDVNISNQIGRIRAQCTRISNASSNLMSHKVEFSRFAISRKGTVRVQLLEAVEMAGLDHTSEDVVSLEISLVPWFESKTYVLEDTSKRTWEFDNDAQFDFSYPGPPPKDIRPVIALKINTAESGLYGQLSLESILMSNEQNIKVGVLMRDSRGVDSGIVMMRMTFVPAKSSNIQQSVEPSENDVIKTETIQVSKMNATREIVPAVVEEAILETNPIPVSHVPLNLCSNPWNIQPGNLHIQIKYCRNLRATSHSNIRDPIVNVKLQPFGYQKTTKPSFNGGANPTWRTESGSIILPVPAASITDAVPQLHLILCDHDESGLESVIGSVDVPLPKERFDGSLEEIISPLLSLSNEELGGRIYFTVQYISKFNAVEQVTNRETFNPAIIRVVALEASDVKLKTKSENSQICVATEIPQIGEFVSTKAVTANRKMNWSPNENHALYFFVDPSLLNNRLEMQLKLVDQTLAKEIGFASFNVWDVADAVCHDFPISNVKNESVGQMKLHVSIVNEWNIVDSSCRKPYEDSSLIVRNLVLCGSSLKNDKTVGRQDPYVKVTFVNHDTSLQTLADVDGGQNPLWYRQQHRSNTVCTLRSPNLQEETVMFEVFDAESFRDINPIGHCAMNVWDLEKNNGVMTLPLVDTANNDTGVLKVQTMLLWNNPIEYMPKTVAAVMHSTEEDIDSLPSSAEAHAAIAIQKIFRTRQSREAAAKSKLAESNASETNAAIAIQKLYRGRQSRESFTLMRKETHEIRELDIIANEALERAMARNMLEHSAVVTIQMAVREWIERLRISNSLARNRLLEQELQIKLLRCAILIQCFCRRVLAKQELNKLRLAKIQQRIEEHQHQKAVMKQQAVNANVVVEQTPEVVVEKKPEVEAQPIVTPQEAKLPIAAASVTPLPFKGITQVKIEILNGVDMSLPEKLFKGKQGPKVKLTLYPGGATFSSGFANAPHSPVWTRANRSNLLIPRVLVDSGPIVLQVAILKPRKTLSFGNVSSFATGQLNIENAPGIFGTGALFVVHLKNEGGEDVGGISLRIACIADAQEPEKLSPQPLTKSSSKSKGIAPEIEVPATKIVATRAEVDSARIDLAKLRESKLNTPQSSCRSSYDEDSGSVSESPSSWSVSFESWSRSSFEGKSGSPLSTPRTSARDATHSRHTKK